jgi:hypothetical protein
MVKILLADGKSLLGVHETLQDYFNHLREIKKKPAKGTLTSCKSMSGSSIGIFFGIR